MRMRCHIRLGREYHSAQGAGASLPPEKGKRNERHYDHATESVARPGAGSQVENATGDADESHLYAGAIGGLDT